MRIKRQKKYNVLSSRLDRAYGYLSKEHPLIQISLGILSPLLALILKLNLDRWIGRETTFLLFPFAILFSTLYGGLLAGSIATVLCTIFVAYFFLVPFGAFTLKAFNLGIPLAVFVLESFLVIYVVRKSKNAEIELKERVGQQAIISALSQYGLQEETVDSFFEKSVNAIVKILKVDYCELLELIPKKDTLRLRSGFGWKRGSIGKVDLPANTNSQGGYTLEVHKPVIVHDLDKEIRFTPSDLLKYHNVISGLSVIIGDKDNPYGVLGVHTRKFREFTKNDVNFLQAAANVIATTIHRKRAQESVELMADISGALTSSFDIKATIHELVRIIVPKFADMCELYVVSDGEVKMLEVAALTKSKEKMLLEMARKYPPLQSTKRYAASALRYGNPLLVSEITDERLKSVAADERQKQLLLGLKGRSLIAVPLKIRNKVTGVMIFVISESRKRYTNADLVTAKEIADRVAVAIDNAQLYQNAQSAIKARDEFLSIATHELKTPLTSMLLQLQSVLYSMKTQSLANFSIERTLQMLESTIGQSKRLSKLINDLLNVSLITTGKLVLDKETVELGALIRDVIKRIEPDLERSGSKLSIHVDKQIKGAWDKIRIDQVVTNLLTNAIKYGKGNDIELTAKKLNSHAQVIVTDHGIGISPEKQKVIFERFERGDAKKDYKGLGVGLYIVQQIIKAHGGKIMLDSEPGKGSTFTVELSLRK